MILFKQPPIQSPTKSGPPKLPPGVLLRDYRDSDYNDLIRLYHEGMLSEAVNVMDPAVERSFIVDTYQSCPEDRLWVADAGGKVVASIGVTQNEHQVAHIRRLRVDPVFQQWENGQLIRTMVEMAAEHARSSDALKLVIHTPVNDERAIAFLHQLGFEFAQIRDRAGKHLLEFYLNIYQPAPRRSTTTHSPEATE